MFPNIQSDNQTYLRQTETAFVGTDLGGEAELPRPTTTSMASDTEPLPYRESFIHPSQRVIM